MKIPLNDLSRGIARSEEAQSAILSVLQSGHWVHGPEHKGFEIELAKFLNVSHVLGVASGTDALEIALRAIGCTNGSKIISVANAGGYTSIAAAAIGCEVIYCDVDPEKLLIDPESLSALLSEEIAAVVVTHLYGNVAPVGAIRRMCEPFGIKIIEDCAQAIGASEDRKRVGTIGHVGTFSFYPTKNLGAIGDGGALATDDSKIAQKILELRQYGWTSKYKIDISDGMNSRLDEIQAAILRIGLSKLDLMNLRRRQIVEKYSEVLKGSELKLVTSSTLFVNMSDFNWS
jgi:dTDP-4-amino-4,6-dideoxygalactose transaminase